MFLKSIRFIDLLPAFLIQLSGLLVRGLRWSILLGETSKWFQGFLGQSIGYLGNSLFPGRAGEAMRTFIIARAMGLPISFVLGTVAIERLLDVVAVVLIAAIGLFIIEGLPSWMAGTVLTMGLAAMLGIVFVTKSETTFSSFLQKLILKWPSQSSRILWLRGRLIQFVRGANSIYVPSRMLFFLILTGVIWSIDAFAKFSMADAIGLEIGIIEMMLLTAALALSSAIPSTPGYVGVYQFTAVAVLVPLGISQEAALAFIIVFQGMTLVQLIIWGILGVFILGLPRWPRSAERS